MPDSKALHLQALQGRFDALIDLDRARESVAELEALVSAHPLDEKLWAQPYLSCDQSSGYETPALCIRLNALLTDHPCGPGLFPTTRST